MKAITIFFRICHKDIIFVLFAAGRQMGNGKGSSSKEGKTNAE
jgi:hypothetical protein